MAGKYNVFSVIMVQRYPMICHGSCNFLQRRKLNTLKGKTHPDPKSWPANIA